MSQHKEKICQQAKYNIFKTMLCKELKSNFREHLCTFNKIQEVKIEKKDMSADEERNVIVRQGK